MFKFILLTGIWLGIIGAAASFFKEKRERARREAEEAARKKALRERLNAMLNSASERR